MYSALYECTSGPGGWNEGDWIDVRSPRWDHPGGETYSSMLVADLLGGDMRVRTSAATLLIFAWRR